MATETIFSTVVCLNFIALRNSILAGRSPRHLDIECPMKVTTQETSTFGGPRRRTLAPPRCKPIAAHNMQRHSTAFKTISETEMPANHSLKTTKRVERQSTNVVWRPMQSGGVSFPSTHDTNCNRSATRRRPYPRLVTIVAITATTLLCAMFPNHLPVAQAWVLLPKQTRATVGYLQEQQRRISAHGLASPTAAASSQKSSDEATVTLGFLSFDLDDTLFPTSEVVNEANAVMIEHMRSKGFETTLPDFLDTTRQIRKGLDGPITYTDLRKLAIEADMERVRTIKEGEGSIITKALVEECYGVWIQERHDAAERYVFSDAIVTLEGIRKKYPDTCVAAITNGRGNPLEMTHTLKPFFEFCVSGEDDDVFPNRKPHAGIYTKSLERYKELYPHHHEKEEETVKRIWCHIGDCLANDVGASADCGAYAVWYNPEDSVTESAQSRLSPSESSSTGDSEKGTPSWSTASAEDVKKRTALANEGKEKIAVRISSLSELGSAIDELLASAATSVSTSST